MIPTLDFSHKTLPQRPETYPLTPLGIILRKFRIDLGISLHAMASEIAVSASLLSQIETGKKPLGEKTAWNMERFFHARKIPFPDFWARVEQSNGKVAVSALSQDHALLVAEVAHSKISEETAFQIRQLLKAKLS